MKCIDFDRHFADYTTKWVRENTGKFANVDEMELHFPSVYEEWLNTPADFLGRVAPADYFAQYDDAKLLVKWMRDYFKQNIPVPDLLLDRLSALKEDAPAELMILLSKPERDEDEAKLCAIGLMTELESDLAFDLYIGWIAAGEQKDDIAERAADAMCDNEKTPLYKEKLISAYDNATESGKLRLLDIMAYLTGDGRIFALLLENFEAGKNRALFASYLQKYGDAKALPALKKALNDSATRYLDYIEIKNVIEYFGETVADERDFSGDDDYEALKGI